MDLELYSFAHKAWIGGAAKCELNKAMAAPVKFQLHPVGTAIARYVGNKKVHRAQLCLYKARKALEVALRKERGIAKGYAKIKAEIAGDHFRPKIIGTWRGARVA